jgi:hypothetical protein
MIKTPTMTKKYNAGNAGPLVASIIIVIVLLISAFYALKERPLKTDVNVVDDADIKLLETQSESTELIDIEADLNATNLDDLGLDLEAAEAEL